MSIIINKPTIFNKNIQLESFYIRLSINLNLNGKKILIQPFFYQSKITYKINETSILQSDFLNYLLIDCDLKNIIDIIKYSHEKYIEYLTTDKIIKSELNIDNINISDIKIENNIVLYNDTILFNNDKNKKYLIEDNKLFYINTYQYKFFEPTEVTIVDLD